MIRADGKGALPFPFPNFKRPRRNRISTPGRGLWVAASHTLSCHHFVSVRLGTRQTTVQPSRASSVAFVIKRWTRL
jgi:hypothetical protein